MKKSILALGLCVVLMFSLTAYAFAGPVIDGFIDSTTSDFTYSYTDDTTTNFDGMYYDRNSAGRSTNNAIDKGIRVTRDGSGSASQQYNPHGNFTNNSFACAECHRTHEAAGAKLIRRNSNTNLCFACHDGSSSAYDVVSGRVMGVKNSTAGGFGTYQIPGKARNTSITTHSVNPDTAVLSAPGGDPDKDWKLECVNCHNPHGQTVTVGSWTGTKDGATRTQTGNDRLLECAPVSITVYDDVFSILEPLAPGTYTTADDTEFEITETNRWWRMKEDPRVSNTAIGPTFSRVWKTEQGAARPIVYRAPYNPVTHVAGAAYGDPLVPIYVLTMKDEVNPSDPTKNFTMIKWDTTSVGPNETLRAEFRPIMVKPTVMSFTNKYQTNEGVTYLGNMNIYCSTCHYDYYQNLGGSSTGDGDDGMNGSTARQLTGVYSQAFRHAIGTSGYAWWYNNAAVYLGVYNNMSIEAQSGNNGTVICQSCHYVHGSPAASLDREKNNSGADNSLLKQDNRIVCQACHNKIDNGTDSTPFINESLVNWRK